MSWEIASSLQRPSEAFTARHLLDGAGGTLPSARLDDARLIVSELVTNAVRHGSLGGPVDLVVRWNGQTMRLEVHSIGRFRPPPGHRRHGALDDHGWGLVLVDALADRWGVDRGSDTTVWAEIESGADT